MIAGFAMQGIVSQDEGLRLFGRELESLRIQVQQQLIADLRSDFEDMFQEVLTSSQTRFTAVGRTLSVSPTNAASVAPDSPAAAVDDELRIAAKPNINVASFGRSGFVDYITSPTSKQGQRKVLADAKADKLSENTPAINTGASPRASPRAPGRIVGFLPNVPEGVEEKERDREGRDSSLGESSESWAVTKATRNTSYRSNDSCASFFHTGTGTRYPNPRRRASRRVGPVQRLAKRIGLGWLFNRKEAWSRMATIQGEIHAQLGHSNSDIVDPSRRHGKMHELVASYSFDYFMGFLLVLNAICIGVEVDWEASNLTEDEPVAFGWIDRIFAFVFLCELLARLYVFRFRFYLMKGCFWSYFDTAIVSIQLVEVVSQIIDAASDDSGTSESPIDSDFLKLLKMGRLLRVVRMVRLIPELKSMVYLILASMSSFIWTCALLSLLIYLIAVYMTMVATTSLKESASNLDTSNMSSARLARVDNIRLYWGSIGSAILSAIWSITGGVDWKDVISPLVEETKNETHNVVFVMFVAFSTMVIMNLVTGVFVEGAQRLKREDRDKELIKMAHTTFNVVGDDSSFDEVTREEFDQHMQDGHMDAYLSAMDLSKTSACDLFELIDEDKSGLINVQEFVSGCMRLRGNPRAADVSQILVDVRKLAQNLDQLNEHADAKAEAYQRRVEARLEELARLSEAALSPPVPQLASFQTEATKEPTLQYFPEKAELDWFFASR